MAMTISNERSKTNSEHPSLRDVTNCMMNTPVHLVPPMRSFPDQRAEWREHKTKLQSTKTSPLRRGNSEILSAQTKAVAADERATCCCTVRAAHDEEQNCRADPLNPRVDCSVKRYEVDFQRLWLLLDVCESINRQHSVKSLQSATRCVVRRQRATTCG